MSWDEMADWWDSRMGFSGDWFNNELIKPYLEDFIRGQNLFTKSIKVLDVGCGNGHLCRFFDSMGLEVIGIDTSSKMIEKAQNYGTNIQYYAVGLDHQLLKNKTFDLIVLNNVLQDSPDVTPILSQLIGLTTKTSQVIIIIRHPCFHPKSNELGWFIEDSHGVRSYTGQGLTKFIDQRENVRGIYFAMDNYFEKEQNSRVWEFGSTMSYNRTLSFYIKSFLDCGFEILDIAEPKPQTIISSIEQLANRIPIFLIFRLGVRQ